MQHPTPIKIKTQPLRIPPPFRHSPPIPQPAHPIPIRAAPLKILPARPPQRRQRRHTAPGPQRRDAALAPLLHTRARRAGLVPAPALGAEDGAAEEGVAITRKVLDALGTGLDGGEVLAAELAERLPDVAGDGLDDDDEVAVADAGVWAEGLEEIGEAVRAHREVGFWPGVVAGLQRLAVAADNRDAAAVGGVEAGGADDGVDGAVGAVAGDDAGGGEVGDCGGDDDDVGGGQGFEVAWPRGEAAAERGKVREHVGYYLGFGGESGAHVLVEGYAGSVMLFRASVGDGVGALHACFEEFAVFEVGGGIFAPLLPFLGRVIEVAVLAVVAFTNEFVAECGRYPGLAADVLVHSLDVWLD